MSEYRVIEGDCRNVLYTLDAGSVQTCVTSPPYFGLRDYGHDGQIGLEETPEQYVAEMVAVFRDVRRVLRDDGTLWLNLGDSYAVNGGARQYGSTDGATGRADAPGDPRRAPTGYKAKDLLGIPWMVAFALRADGWYLRSDIVWHKPNPMPESVQDRPTRAHEYIFLLTKSARYFYDSEAIREEATYAGPNGQQHSPYGQGFTKRTPEQERARQDKQRGHGRRHDGFNDRWDAMSRAEQSALGRNKRSVWTVATRPFSDAHFAVYPMQLIEPCVLAGSKAGDTVLDPFNGSGTTGLVALRHDRDYIGIELNPEYAQMARDRIYNDGPLLNVEVAA